MNKLDLKLQARRTAKAGPAGSKTVRTHALMITALAVGAGMASALAATSGTGPLAGLHRQHPSSIALTSHLVHGSLPVTPIDAATLFPPSPVVQKVVDMYDLPPVTPTVLPRPTYGGEDGEEGDD